MATAQELILSLLTARRKEADLEGLRPSEPLGVFASERARALATFAGAVLPAIVW